MTLPLWLAIPVLVLAAIAVLDRLLAPGVRWWLRRRVNRALDEANRRLRIRLQPFKLTRRQSLVDRLVHDPQVAAAVDALAGRDEVPREVLSRRVERYAREIVPAFNAYVYFRLGSWLARRVARLLYRVRLGSVDQDALAAVPPDATVVFVMNHRSNMDYLLVSYLVAESTALSYAVGEWAKIWPLDTLIRSMGAYFVRRDSGDELYRRVLARYVAMATREGVTQAVYPEGGLSRDGKLRSPKLGLLDYMLRDFDPGGERDLVFVPVGINYDRVLEDRTLLLDGEPARRRGGIGHALWTFGRFAGRNLWLMVTGRWYRFGYACVSFGTPLSMRSHLAERRLDLRRLERGERFERVAEVAGRLMAEVSRIIPALPVALVSTVLLEREERAISRLELKAEAQRLIERLEAAGRRVYVPRGDRDYAIEVGLRMLVLRHLVDEQAGMFKARPSERALLRYYAGSIPPASADRTG